METLVLAVASMEALAEARVKAVLDLPLLMQGLGLILELTMKTGP